MFNETMIPERQSQFDEFCRLFDKWLKSLCDDDKADVYDNLNEPIVKDKDPARPGKEGSKRRT